MAAGTPGPSRPILELHFPRSISGTLTLTRAGLGAVVHGLMVPLVGIHSSQRPPVPTVVNPSLYDPSRILTIPPCLWATGPFPK